MSLGEAVQFLGQKSLQGTEKAVVVHAFGVQVPSTTVDHM